MKSIYLTTPLYYVNDVPHIGHAYTTLAADIFARWKRLRGEQVHFLTGTDEHGQKIAEAAAKAGENPQEFVDRVAASFQNAWKTLSISNDDFIRTSEPRHKRVVQAVFERLKNSGDIYKGTYEDWYCLSDEAYFSESELVNMKCPNCGRDVQKLKEESYFFRLSKYQEPLLAHFAKNPDFLSPSPRASEIVNFVKSGLKDLSVSRSRVKWGVQILSEPEHTVYVWFDALLNYISAIGYDTNKPGGGPSFTEKWPADVHLVGKEIFRFHTVIWPAMLMALEIPLPKKVFAHGWWTVDGTKMSKSLGNVVDPNKMVANHGADAFRYFLFREVPFGSDGDFSEKNFVTRFNAELANNLGNLLQRTTTLIVKNFEGKIPPVKATPSFAGDFAEIVRGFDADIDRLAFGDALDRVYGLLIRTNKFIDEKAPWGMGPDKRDELASVLVECLMIVKVLAVLLHPFMPHKTAEIWARLGETGEVAKNGADQMRTWKEGKAPSFQEGQTVTKGDPLFMRKAVQKK